MLYYSRAVRKAAARIAAASDRSVGALKAGRVEQEPAMTDRLLGAIEESLQGAEIRGIRWEAKTLTDRGRGAQERQFGADFLGVLSIDMPGYQVSKGFLAQAKIDRPFRSADREILKGQCEKMLGLSPASFVFLYSHGGVFIVPALSVAALGGDVAGLYRRSVQRFFEEHLECFIGVRSISAATPTTLEGLRERANARSAILLRAKSMSAQQ